MQTEFRQGHSRVCNNQQSLHLIHFNVRAWQVGLNESRLQMKGWWETRRLIDDWGSLISGWAPNMLYNSGRYIVVWTCGWELTLRWHKPGTHVVCMCVYICVHGYNLSIITCMSVCSPVTSKRGLIHRSRQCVCVCMCTRKDGKPINPQICPRICPWTVCSDPGSVLYFLPSGRKFDVQGGKMISKQT